MGFLVFGSLTMATIMRALQIILAIGIPLAATTVIPISDSEDLDRAGGVITAALIGAGATLLTDGGSGGTYTTITRDDFLF